MTDRIDQDIYTADVRVTGGRGGRAVSDDGLIDVPLARPGQGTATNPEQLMAAGWGACFQSALAVAAKGTGIPTRDSVVRVRVTLGSMASGIYAIKSAIAVHLPGVDLDEAQRLVDRTHTICPYSRATAGNIETTVTAVDESSVHGPR